MSKETQQLIKAPESAASKARKRAKRHNYNFIQFDNGILYQTKNGHKRLLKKISNYEKTKEEILKDQRIAW
ncbi:MAG: hypothetical protein ABUK01_06320 [Leptospirales bacterium]